MSGNHPNRHPADLPNKRSNGFYHTRSAPTVFALVAVLVMTLASFASVSAGPSAQPQQPTQDVQGEHRRQEDRDNRRGSRAPDTRQRSAATAKGARVRWNNFGTPATILADGAFIDTGLVGDEVSAARAWVLQNRELFRLSEQDVADLELIYSAPLGAGRAVMFRQRFGNLPTGHDGLLGLSVVGDKLAYVSSSIAGNGNAPGPATLSATGALQTAAADAGRQIALNQINEIASTSNAREFTVAGFSQPARARLVAVPTPLNGVRTAWEITLIDNSAEPLAFTSYVDAQTSDVLLRENLVDYFDPDDPRWSVFPNAPPPNYASNDTRDLWCWSIVFAGCDRILADAATAAIAWDIDPATGEPTFTTNGNNAIAVHNWFSNDPFSVGTETATPRLDRNYNYDWTNQWYEQRCNPDTTFTSLQRNDIDAARANLFAMHNQMHDWSYHLGFTEATFNMQRSNFGLGGLGNDPERGNAQAGGVSGGPASGFAARDNANQITGADGIAPITNMYLWQPIAATFYAPCVDGDYDMSVIGHEYTHAISNRMVAGPNSGLSGNQAGAMGESWSDLSAMEILNEFGFAPLANENRYAIGPYVTNDPQAGIRNYGMNVSPLNYSDVGYDFACNTATCVQLTQVHADGEIWSATNFAIRQAMNARYDGAYPSSNAALQGSCAEGLTPVAECPGNRRWIQLVYDGWLLMSAGTVSMIDARDAMLAADLTRFGGANQDLLWNVFASRGLGQFASSLGANDTDPVPSFESPHSNEVTVVFAPSDGDGNPIPNAQLFVGRYEARVTPVADTNPATALGDQVRMVPGTYELVIRAPGYGHARATLTLRANQVTKLLAGPLIPNLASSARGATASGNGTNLGALIDDTEVTNWAFLGQQTVGGLEAVGKQVTVRLDPSKPFHQIRRIQVSALLRHRIPADPGGDTLAQNRYTALRQFEIWACQAQGSVDCSQDSQFTLIYTSPTDAFPAVAPRPRAPNMIIRSFDIPRTRATHVRLRVVNNQCTGGPAYQGDQDDDPLNITDCDQGSVQGNNVRAAELQVFSH
jgi:extracellular elastinolytic metalloproteinase